MLTLDPARSLLLIIDFQARLMPAIHEGEAALQNAQRLLEAARLMAIARLFTEQNPKGLGTTVPALAIGTDKVVHKMSFDVCREEGFLESIAADRHVVVAGCEAHVCVLQSVLGLLQGARKTYVVSDAIGARRPASKEAALARMARHGAEIVTTEMVVFEWLGTVLHPDFRAAAALIK